MVRLKFDGTDTKKERQRVLARLASRHEELLQKLEVEKEDRIKKLIVEKTAFPGRPFPEHRDRLSPSPGQQQGGRQEQH